MVDTESIKTKVEIEIEDAERSLDEMETTMGDYGGEMEAQQQSYQGELEKTGASWLEVGAIAGGTLYGIAKLSPLMGGFMSTWKDQLGAIADLWFVTNSEGLNGITMMFSDATGLYSAWKNDLSEGESEVAEYLTNPFLYWMGKYDDVKEHFEDPEKSPWEVLIDDAGEFTDVVGFAFGSNATGLQGLIDGIAYDKAEEKWKTARKTLSEWGAETPDELFTNLGATAETIMDGVTDKWQDFLDFIGPDEGEPNGPAQPPISAPDLMLPGGLGNVKDVIPILEIIANNTAKNNIVPPGYQASSYSGDEDQVDFVGARWMGVG